MRQTPIVALFAAALILTGCETSDRGYGGGRSHYYGGGDYDRLGNDCRAIGGSGGRLLDPWLACTDEGEQLVGELFDGDRDGRISRKTADRANIWFRRHADTNRNMRLTDPEIKAALTTYVLRIGVRR